MKYKDMINVKYELSNGIKIPALGLGTWQVSNDISVRVVMDVLNVGYRHINTAALYDNEEGIGEVIRESGIVRSEIFLTTKCLH